MALIRAILQGIKDTAAAAEIAMEEEENLVNTLMALSESAQPQPHKPPTTVSSKLPKSGGGYLSIDFNTWKPQIC